MTTNSEFLGWPTVLSLLLGGQDLSADVAASAVSEILRGDATSAQITAFIIALRAKGETEAELTGMLGAVRVAGVAVTLPENIASRAIDIVGTGGGSSQLQVDGGRPASFYGGTPNVDGGYPSSTLTGSYTGSYDGGVS